MAYSCFSDKDIRIEALFGETNNICICTRVHLKDYYFKTKDKLDSCDGYEAFNDEITEECHDNPDDPRKEELKDPPEDSEIAYDYVCDEDIELMKSMGLPTSFGKRYKFEPKYDNYYSAYNYDGNEATSEDEESGYSFESDIDDFGNHQCETDTNLIVKSNKVSSVSSKDLNNSKIGYSNLNAHNPSDEFESFWSLHGYNVCMNSWIKKYKSFVSPEYLDVSQETEINNLKVIDSKENSVESLIDNKCVEDDCTIKEICDSSGISKNCDSVLKNVNDKFQCMSFLDNNQARFMNDQNAISSDIDSKTSSAESGTFDDSEMIFENDDMYSENLLIYNNVDVAETRHLTDRFEKCVSAIDFEEDKTASKTPQNDFTAKDSLNADYSNNIDNQFIHPMTHEDDFISDALINPELFSPRKTDNPLFNCTKTDEEYEKSRMESSLTWEELWAIHCQEEQEKYSKFFLENPTMFSDCSSYAKKCEFCCELSCSVCQSEIKNGALYVGDATRKNIFNAIRNEILVYPVVDTYVTKDLPVSENIFENDVEQDDQPPVELPIKRSHEVESESEEPEDAIKELGLVVHSENALKIKKKKRRRRHKRRKCQQRTFNFDGTNEDDEEIKRANAYPDCDNNETSITKVNEIDSTKDTVVLVAQESGKANADPICDNHSNTTTVDEADKSIASESSELIHSVNTKCKKAVPTENSQHADKDSDSTAGSCQKDNILDKYWHQRYRLFHRFDEGVMLDEESWFSVTPETIAYHIADRCACGVMIDAFCGAGGNAIQFASFCYHVIAIDIDPKKVEIAKHNATIYGVADYIDFIVGDYFDIVPSLKADGIFLSPPWGGPSYADDAEYDISKIEPDIYKVFEVSRKITENIAVFVPRNTIVNQLVKLAGEGNNVEIEQNFLNKKVKTITAYYGDFVTHTDSGNIEACAT